MLEFVVHVKGEAEESGYWVLFVDAIGERFLVSGEDREFRWVPIANCTLGRAATPDSPRPVLLMQPKQGLAVPAQLRGNGHGR